MRASLGSQLFITFVLRLSSRAKEPAKLVIQSGSQVPLASGEVYGEAGEGGEDGQRRF